MSNVTFDGRNYIAYEQWVREKYGKLTGLQVAHKEALQDADKVCRVCTTLPDDVRHCSGFRRYFDKRASEAKGSPVVLMQGCHKLGSLQDKRALEGRFESSLLFKPVVRLLKNQRDNTLSPVSAEVVEEDFGYRIGKLNLPLFSWVPDDLQQTNRELLVDYLGAMLYSGRKAVYLRTPDFYNACLGRFTKDVDASKVYRELRYPEDIYVPALEADWLVIVNLHGVCPISRFRGILFDVVQSRYDSGKATTLVLNQPFDVKSEQEKAVMKLVESWDKLNLGK